MLTLKLISEETERVIKGLEKKHFEGAREAVEKVLEYDKIRREAQQKLDSNKQQQNQLAKQIGGLMKEGKKEEAEKIKNTVAELKATDKALQEIMDKAQGDMTQTLLDIPNIPNDRVPEGKDASSNVVIKKNFNPILFRIKSIDIYIPTIPNKKFTISTQSGRLNKNNSPLSKLYK